MTEPVAAILIKTTSTTAELAPVRRQIEHFSRSVGFDDRAIGEIGLCVNEAMANIIRHAYRGQADKPIEVGASFTDGMLLISLRDWGEGLAPGPLPEVKHDPMNPGGLGLICLGRLMDKITFTPQQPGMLLEMRRAHVEKDLAKTTPTATPDTSKANPT